MYKSQYKQDKWLNENIFHNRKGGIFIDVGAHDGITINNTYFFEKELEWKGICIEPNPTIYEKLRQNRDGECINACAYNKEGEVKFVCLNGYTEMLSGVEEAYNTLHKMRIHSEISQYGGGIKHINVQAHTLSKILSDRNITHVEYLSIDTEGSELQVLQGIDFSKVTFDVIDVEVNYPEEHEPLFNDLLFKNGYKFLTKLGGDNIYVSNKIDL